MTEPIAVPPIRQQANIISNGSNVWGTVLMCVNLLWLIGLIMWFAIGAPPLLRVFENMGMTLPAPTRMWIQIRSSSLGFMACVAVMLFMCAAVVLMRFAVSARIGNKINLAILLVGLASSLTAIVAFFLSMASLINGMQIKLLAH